MCVRYIPTPPGYTYPTDSYLQVYPPPGYTYPGGSLYRRKMPGSGLGPCEEDRAGALYRNTRDRITDTQTQLKTLRSFLGGQ